MHQSGVTCSNCHEPHSGELRAADNNLCTQCHETSVYDAATHHRHQGGVSKGSFFGDGTRCVDCHMPRVTYMGVDVRHDHSFRVPRPDLSVRFDTPNACTTCHQDRDASWAARERVRLYGPPKTEAGRDVFSLLLAAEVGDPSARSALLAFATDETAPEMLRDMALTQGAALSQGTALSEGGETSDFRTLEAVVQRLSSDPSDLVRLSALSAAGRLPVPLRVPHLAGRLDDRVRAVRVEAMRQLLTEVPAGARANLTAKLSQAAREFKEAQKPFLDRASVRTEIAALELGLGDADSAETWLRRALEVDPTQLPAAINLSDLYRSRGDEKNAEATLRAILLRLPDAAPAHYALGLSLIRQKQLDDALDFLVKPRPLDPESVEYALTYAVALQSIGRLDAALTELSAGLRGRPYAAELHRARVSYLYGAGRKDEAVSALQDWLSADPESPEARSLAERLR